MLSLRSPCPTCSPSAAPPLPLRRPRRWPPLPRPSVAVATAAAVTAAAAAVVLTGMTPVPTAAAAATTRPTSGAPTTSRPAPPLPAPPHPSSDGDCDAAVTASAATGSLPAAVRALVTQSTYFAIFKVNLERPCPYWPDDSMCAVRDCSVCACEPDEVPPLWRAADALRTNSRAAQLLTPGGGSLSRAEGGTTDADSATVLTTTAGGGAAGRTAAAGIPGGVSSATTAALVDSNAVAAEPAAAVACDAGGRDDALNDVDRRVAAGADAGGWAAGGAAAADAWTEVDDDADMTYVDLRANVERFTGYAGASAARVWRVIYEENCFRYGQRAAGGEGSSPAGGLTGLGLGPPGDGGAAAAAPSPTNPSGPNGGGEDAATPSSTIVAGAAAAATSECKEERVFYRLLSGIHTSINMHIAAEYLFPSGWGPNLALYKARVAAYPDRVSNLYFTLAVVLRAVAKAAPSLAPGVTHYTTGNSTCDMLTARLVSNVLGSHPLLAPGCAMRTFNESDMFLGGPAGGGGGSSGAGGGAALAAAAEAGDVPATLAASSSAEARTEFRDAFRNVSTIMDCVGCEKCRLWGKLQFLGLGTALRILFSPHGGEATGLALQRNEIIALFNLLNKLLSSVEEMARMDGLLAADAAAAATAAWWRAAAAWLGGGALVVAAFAVALRRREPPVATVTPAEVDGQAGGATTASVRPKETSVAGAVDGDQPGEGATEPRVVRSREASAMAATGGVARRRRPKK